MVAPKALTNDPNIPLDWDKFGDYSMYGSTFFTDNFMVFSIKLLLLAG